MTVGTAVEKESLDSRRVVQGMSTMALKAEERHGRIEQVVDNGAMGSMTVGAVFGYVAMLVNKRSLFLHMAPGAGLLWRAS